MSASSSGTEMNDSDGSVISKRSRVSKSGRKRNISSVQDQNIAILREELQQSQRQISKLCELLELAKDEINKLKNANSAPHVVARLPTSNSFEVLDMDTANSTEKKCNRVITRQSEGAVPKHRNNDESIDKSTNQSTKTSSANGNRSDKSAMNGQSPKTKSKPPPPIMAYNLDTKKCIDELKITLGHDKFGLVRLNSNCTKVVTHSLADYKKTCDLMQQGQAEHFTFTPKEEQKIGLLLKGMDRSYDETDIKCALESSNLKINVCKIFKFGKQNEKAPPMWLIQFEPGCDIKSVLETGYLLNQKVSFERLRGGHILQCRRCQRFGHSATNCRLKFRCMKCTVNHDPGECLNVLNDDETNPSPPAACVNCGQVGHPANFRGCPKYAAIIKARQDEFKKRREQQLFKQKAVQNIYRNDVTFAEILRPVAAHNKNHGHTDARNRSTSINTGESNCLSFLNTECETYFSMGFAEIIAKTTAFVPKYEQMNASSKPFELIQFVLSITPRTNNG